MPRRAKERTVAAAEHDDFFNLVRDKLHMASEDARILGRLYKLDTGGREGAHLGAVIRFVAEFVVEGEYDPAMVLADLRSMMDEVRQDLEDDVVEPDEVDLDDEDDRPAGRR
jgi:hypothetical protein